MLFKSVWRYFKRSWVLASLLTVVIFLSAFIYGVMAHSVGAIEAPTEAYFKAYRQEDFHLVPMPFITPSDREHTSIPLAIRSTSALYEVDPEAFFALHERRLEALARPGLTLEARFSKDFNSPFDEASHTFRVLRPNTMVNQTKIVDGRLPEAIGEVMLLPVYAEAWGYNVGDTLTLQGETLEIVGLFMVPDYSLVMFGEAFILNTQSRTIVMVDETQFARFNGTLEVSYGVLGSLDFLPELIASENVLTGFSTRNTLRSGAIYDELAGGEAFGLSLSLLIAGIGVFVVYVMVHKMLQDQRGPIGILKALGYAPNAIVIPYLVFVLLLALPGLVLGYLVGLWVAPSLTGLYQLLYVLPTTHVVFSWRVFLLSTLLPLTVLVGLGTWVTSRLVREDALKLLNPKPIKPPKVKAHQTQVDPHSKWFMLRLSWQYLVRQRAALMVFLLGMSSALYLIFLGFSMQSSFDRMNALTFDQLNYEYVGICPLLTGCTAQQRAQGEGVIELPDVLVGDIPVVVVGLDTDSQHLPLQQDGQTITYLLSSEDIIVTRALAMKGRYRIGDTVKLEFGDLTLERTVVGIHEDYLNDRIFLERRAFSLLVSEGLTNDFVNVIYSEAPLDDSFSLVMSVSELREQSEWITQLSVVMFFWMTAASLGMGLVVMLLVMLMVFEHKRYDMQVFSLLGYEKKTLDRIFIHPYGVLMIALFLGMIPVAYGTFEIIMFYFATRFNMIFLMVLNPWHLVVVFIFAILMYGISRLILSRQWAKLSLAQSLSQMIT